MKKINLNFKKIFSGKFFGQFNSFFAGDGLELKSIREYVLGDNPKYINWKTTAKQQKFFVNLFQQQKDVELHIFFDVNINWFGGNIRQNFQLVEKVFLDVVSQAKSFNAMIFAYYFDKKFQKIYIGNNYENSVHFINSLKKIQINKRYDSKLNNFLDVEKNIAKRRIILIFSDFLSLSIEDEKKIKILLEQNEVVLCRLICNKFEGLNYDFFTLQKKVGQKLHFFDIYI